MPLITTFGAGSVRGLGRAARLVPPGAPTNFLATGRTRVDGAGGATVSFTAPVDNGGAPITGYQVENLSNGQITSVSSGSVVSLSNNTEQTFRVRAINAAGAGAWSNTDTAFAGYWTYQPGNGGGSASFTIPAGVSSISYQVFSNGGAPTKPDTRYYATMYPSQLMWWGTTDLIYFPPVDLDTPRYFTYHRQADYWYWWSYGPNWEYMYGTMTYSHGNFTQGSTEYYMIVPTNSGPGWTANEHIGWYMISPSPTQVLAGGSPPSGPTSGGNSTITVPSWGTDNTGPGYGGSSNSVSNTAPVSPGMNVTVNIGSSSGDYQYSNPGYAVIAYGR